MKVFVDECVDWRLARDIVGHEVRSAREMGWSTIKNGELLALAAREFEAFATVDRQRAGVSFTRMKIAMGNRGARPDLMEVAQWPQP